MRGFYGIGVEHAKTEMNIGTLWRSAEIFDAAFLFTIGARYKKQASDTSKTWRTIPLYNYLTFAELYASLPYDTRLVGVELDEKAFQIRTYAHPERCIYLLGAEDHGLTAEALRRCHSLVRLPGERSMNVATAGSIIMFDRHQKEKS